MIINGSNGEIWEIITMKSWDLLGEKSRDIISTKNDGIKFVKIIRRKYPVGEFINFEIVNF